MANYQKRPEAIDAVEIVNVTPPSDPPFQPPIPAWLTEAIANQAIVWSYDEATTHTTVTLYWPGTTMPRLTGGTGDFLALRPIDQALMILTAAQLTNEWEHGPAVQVQPAS